MSSKSSIWNKNFTLFFICIAQSTFGSAISGVALSFLVLKLTGSASAMSITLALNFLPAILTPFLATFVDRLPLKIPMILGMSLRGLILIGVYFGITFGLVNIYVINTMALITGIITSFYGPASFSLISFLIPKDQLQRGNSFLGMATNSMSLIGLLFGGAIVGFCGPAFALFIEGICYIVSTFLLIFVAMPKSALANLTNSFWKDFVLGLSIIKNSLVIITIVVLFLLLNIVASPMEVLLPIHMTAIGKGAFGYGLFMAFNVSGLLLGNIVISIIGNRLNSYNEVVYGWFCLAGALIGLATLNSFYWCLFWALILGICIAFSSTGITVILQEVVPAEFRGRVFGTMDTVSRVGLPFSLFFLSYIIKKITLVEVFISAAMLSIVFAVIWYRLFCRKTTSWKLVDDSRKFTFES